MALRKLASTDGFVVIDLDGAGRSVGVTRLAPKILVDGAELLARSLTYAFASFDVRIGGASAGINVGAGAGTGAGDREAAVNAFVSEMEPLAAEGELVLYPGLGLTADDLAALPAPPLDPGLTGRAAVASLGPLLGDLTGGRLAIAGGGAEAEAARQAATAVGAEVVGDEVTAECDAVLVAGRAGSIDHVGAAEMRTRAVVPLSPVPVTARALAVLGRAGTVVVPDFLTTAAPLLAAFDPDGDDPVDRVAACVGELASAGTGLWLAAAARAEDHLRTWREELPFGRPLA